MPLIIINVPYVDDVLDLQISHAEYQAGLQQYIKNNERFNWSSALDISTQLNHALREDNVRLRNELKQKEKQ